MSGQSFAVIFAVIKSQARARKSCAHHDPTYVTSSIFAKTYVKPHRWAARMASYVVQCPYIVYYLKPAIFVLSSIDTVSRQLSNRGSYDIRKSRSRLARGLSLSLSLPCLFCSPLLYRFFPRPEEKEGSRWC